MFTTILIFIIVLGVLVFVHELGHFIVARKSGMGVHEFGFGFPPRVVGIQKVDGKWKIVWGKKQLSSESTVYSINAIPFGGFVRIMGEDNDEANDPKSFTNKSFAARFLTLAAGVLMNVLTAWVILSIGFMVGLPVAIDQTSNLPKGAEFNNQYILIGEIKSGSAAEQAGLQNGDVIKLVNKQSFTEIPALQEYIKSHQGESIIFDIQRINESKSISVQTSKDVAPGQGIVGIGLAYYGTLQFGPITALYQGVKTTVNQLQAIVTGLYNVFTSKAGLKQIGGPVKIAQLTGQVADLGILPLLQFTAFLSLNLAILNTLPIPALDGGRMLFLIIEKLRGKPNNQAIEQYANAIGFMVLLGLMVIISIRDISHIESIKNLFS